jgi:cytochrome P450
LATPNETANRIYKFLKFCSDELAWRVENVNSEGDITGWILKAYKDFKNPAEDPMLQGDTRLIVVAGSDTTAATMSYLFYHLAKDPEQARLLREELRPLTKGDWKDVDIKNAPRLNGAINEALRLHPPVPSGVERLVPPEGAQYGNVRLPPNTQFWMPQYTIARDEDYYENASEFVPERWYSKPEMIKHKNAFAPFSLGPAGCIGKNCRSNFRVGWSDQLADHL